MSNQNQISWSWPITSALSSLVAMLLVALIIALPSPWGFVPLSGMLVFFFFLLHNPVGRYLRLSVIVIGGWASIILHSVVDINILFIEYGWASVKIGKIDWYVHLAILVLAIVLLVFDFISREGVYKYGSNGKNLTKNRLVFRKWVLIFLSYVITIVVVGGVITSAKYIIPPSPNKCSNNTLKHQQMFTDFSNGFKSASERSADFILKSCPNDHAALNIKGSLFFFRRSYKDAVNYFKRAHVEKPENKAYIENLASSYIEIGAIDQGIELLLSIENETNDDWVYNIGRAYLLNNKPEEAIKYIKRVPNEYSYKGTARILESATLILLSRLEKDFSESKRLEEEAKKQLFEGIEQDPIHWKQILSGQRIYDRENYEKPIKIINPILLEIGIMQSN